MLPTPKTSTEHMLKVLVDKMSGSPSIAPTPVNNIDHYLLEIAKLYSSGGNSGGNSGGDSGGNSGGDSGGGSGEIPADLLERLERLEHYMDNVFYPSHLKYSVIDFSTFREDGRYVVIDNEYPWAVDFGTTPYSIKSTIEGLHNKKSEIEISFFQTESIGSIEYEYMGQSEGSYDKLTVTCTKDGSRIQVQRSDLMFTRSPFNPTPKTHNIYRRGKRYSSYHIFCPLY